MVKTVRDQLLDILGELTGTQLKRFKGKLNEVQLKPGYKNIPKGKLEKADTDDLSDMLIDYYTYDYAPQVARTVLEELHLKRLVDKLSESVGRPEPEGQAATPSSSFSETQSAAEEQGEESRAYPTAEEQDGPKLRNRTLNPSSEIINVITHPRVKEISQQFWPRVIIFGSLSFVIPVVVVVVVYVINHQGCFSEGQHFMDKYRTKIIQRLSNPEVILDRLHEKKLIGNEAFDRIHAKPTSQDKMRELYLLARTWDCKAKDEFSKILEEEHPHFVQELKS